MSLADFRGRKTARCLVISGVGHRYYDHVAPGGDINGGDIPGTSENATDVKAFVSMGPITAAFDDLGAIARHDPVEVQVLARDAYTSAGVAVDPIETLRRITPPGSTARTRLLTSLPHALAVVDVEVEDDVSAWPTPLFFNIGQECFLADSTAGDGTLGNRYRFVDVARAVAGTQPWRHIASADKGEHPPVTSDVVFWRMRRAEIYAAPIMPGGEAGEWVSAWRGFIDAVPDVVDAGMRIRLRIAPLTAALGLRLGIGMLQTRTVAGFHYMTQGRASSVSIRAHFSKGALFWTDQATVGWAVGPGADEITQPAGTHSHSLDSVFDPSAYAIGNPLHGALIAEPGGNALTPEWLDSFDADTLTFDSAGAIYDTVDDGTLTGIISAAAIQVSRLSLMEGDPGDGELVEWPGRLIEVVNEGTAWQNLYSNVASWGDPGTVPVPVGSSEPRWFTAKIIDQFGVGQTLEAGRNTPVPGATGLDVPVWLDWEIDAGTDCWAGFLLRPPESLAWARGLAPNAGLMTMPTDEAHQGIFSLQDANDGNNWQGVRVPIVGAPIWWYQPRELNIGLFEDDLYTGNGAPQTIRITGEGTDVEVEIQGSTLRAFDGTDKGYSFEVRQTAAGRGGAILQMRADAPFVATQLAVSSGQPANVFILQLLLSGVGSELNHADYDVLPYGCNLATSDVDVDSFEAVTVPQILRGEDESARFEADPSKTFAENVKALLLVAGYQIAMRWDETNGWRLAAIRLGAGMLADSIATITDATCTTDGQPESQVEGRVVRSYSVKVNWPRPGQEGEPDAVEVVDRAAVNASGGDYGERVELELRGVTVPKSVGDLVSYVLPATMPIRGRLGCERIRWTMTVAEDHEGLEAAGLGDTVTFSSAVACDVDPSVAISERACRIVSLKRDHARHRLTLSLVGVPGRFAGYVPAMYVAAVPTATRVTVSANAYSEAPLTDVGYFAVADAVSCVPVGNWAGRAARTITIISGNDVTLSAAHGLAVGDTIRFDDYDAATTAQNYAYLCDDADGLGATPDVGVSIG